MQDGLNLCQVAAGQVSECVALAGNVMLMGPTMGNIQNGLYVVMAPFLFGITVGTVLKMIKKGGTL